MSDDLLEGHNDEKVTVRFSFQPPIPLSGIDSTYIEYIRPGDTLCKLEGDGYSPARLALRRVPHSPDLWRIVANWTSFVGWDGCEGERRCYRIV